MKCPVCKTVDLNLAERQGVEIDYCPECRGVWLDRGELDKIIERSVGQQVQPAPVEPPAPYPAYAPPRYDYHRDKHDDHHGGHHGGHDGARPPLTRVTAACQSGQ